MKIQEGAYFLTKKGKTVYVECIVRDKTEGSHNKKMVVYSYVHEDATADNKKYVCDYKQFKQKYGHN